jgi:hypothetical protein
MNAVPQNALGQNDVDGRAQAGKHLDFENRALHLP